jgi:flagellar protein FlaG
MGINGIDGSAALPPLPISNTGAAVQSSGTAGKTGEAKASGSSAVNAQEVRQREPSKEELRAATELIQEFVSAKNSDIMFSMDDTTGMTVVKVIDRNTKDVIRQIPSQEMLEMAQALDRLQGLLLKQKA